MARLLAMLFPSMSRLTSSEAVAFSLREQPVSPGTDTRGYLGKGNHPQPGWQGHPPRPSADPPQGPSPRSPPKPRPCPGPSAPRAEPGRARGPRHHRGVYSGSGPTSRKARESSRRMGPGRKDTAEPSRAEPTPLPRAPPRNEAGEHHRSRIPAHLPGHRLCLCPTSQRVRKPRGAGRPRRREGSGLAVPGPPRTGGAVKRAA